MKKFLGIIVIAGTLVACNNSGDSTTGTDSTSTDSSTMTSIPPATGDSTNMGADSTHMGADSTGAKKADSTKTKK